MPRDSRKLAEFLSKEGQLLLPMVDLITEAEMGVDELIEVAGRATIEAILLMSAQQVAGPKHPGKAAGEVHWHGRRKGVVNLAERRTSVRWQGVWPARVFSDPCKNLCGCG